MFLPISGSGVTAIEALRRGRRAIAIDLSPMANNILRATIMPTNLLGLHSAFDKIENSVQKEICALYQTECRNCHHKIEFECMIWKNNHPKEIRYKCPDCGDRQEQGCELLPSDIELLNQIDSTVIELPYPKNPLYYGNGKPFMKREKYESLDQLFTKRNLLALAILRDALEKEPNTELRFLLKMAFTSMVHLCSRMTPVRPSRRFSSFWAEPSYWSAPECMEQNVWNTFASSVMGRQGINEAKIESEATFKDIRFAKNLNQLLNGTANILIVTGDSLDFMKQIPDNSIDYIFTDPPDDSSIQYGELAYLWTAWFGNEKAMLKI